MLGVRVTIGVHAILSVLFIAGNLCDVFLPGGLGYFANSYYIQAFIIGFLVAGLPIIAGAVWGISNKQEAPVRVYLLYYLLTVAAVFVANLYTFILFGPCNSLPPILVQPGSKAFVCGLVTLFDVLVLIFITGFTLYGYFLVWSHAEELKHGGSWDLTDLYLQEEYRRANEDPAAEALKHVQQMSLVENYGSFPGLGGEKIYGAYHEMQFPPPRKAPVKRS